MQVMAHNLARWTARIGLGEQTATTKPAVLLPGRTAHTLSPPCICHRAGVQEKFGRALARGLTALVCHRPAQRTTGHHSGAVPSVSSVLMPPPGPSQIRRPQERLQAARRSPAYKRIIAPVTSHPSAVLTPSTVIDRWPCFTQKPGTAFGDCAHPLEASFVIGAQ